MPNDGKRVFSLYPDKSTTYGFVVEPFVLFERIADELFDTMDKVEFARI